MGANYRTFLPILLLGGMLFTVLVFHIILFKKIKPYYNIEQKRKSGKDDEDIVELASSQQEEVPETVITSL